MAILYYRKYVEILPKLGYNVNRKKKKRGRQMNIDSFLDFISCKQQEILEPQLKTYRVYVQNLHNNEIVKLFIEWHNKEEVYLSVMKQFCGANYRILIL